MGVLILMADLVSFLTETNALTAYPRWIYWVVLLLVIGATQLAKLPIKKLTDKITDKTLHKRVNTCIMLIPFVFAFAAAGILYACNYGFSVSTAILWGTTSQVIYKFASRLIKKIASGEEITDSTISTELNAAIAEGEAAESKFNQLVAAIVKKKDKKGE